MAADNANAGAGWKLMTLLLAVATIGAGTCAFTQYRRSSQLHQRLAAASTETTQLKMQLAAAQKNAADLQHQLTSTEQQADSQQQQLQDTQTQLSAAARPDLPIRLGFRRALLGQGEVGMFQNLSNRVLEVTLDVTSPATGARMHRTLTMNPRAIVQIGPGEHWAFAPGQKIELSNPVFRPIVRTVQG